MQCEFDEDYYLRGVATGKSLYENYRWLPDLTRPMAKKIVRHLGVLRDDTIVDFGCARGYVVRALTEMGLGACGVDISEWAVKNSDPTVRARLKIGDRINEDYDWIIAKDTLEHVPHKDIVEVLSNLAMRARKGVFIVVPLMKRNGLTYEVPEYELDSTHHIRWPIWRWISECYTAFSGPEWEISGRYRIRGIKDNYAQFSTANGLITIRRISK